MKKRNVLNIFQPDGMNAVTYYIVIAALIWYSTDTARVFIFSNNAMNTDMKIINTIILYSIAFTIFILTMLLFDRLEKHYKFKAKVVPLIIIGFFYIGMFFMTITYFAFYLIDAHGY